MSVGASAPASGGAPSFSQAFQQELEALFMWRRDVRRFRTDPVAQDEIDKLLMISGSAPSVGLSEPWRFVRVDSNDARARVVSNFETANAAALSEQQEADRALYATLKLAGLREAPVHLAVFCDESSAQGSGLGAATMPEMRRYSVVCAVMQMWLAARAAGLGMGWVSILDPDRLKQDLRIDPDWALIAYLCIGWPEENHLDCELERAGWEDRRRLKGRVFTR